MYTEYDYRNELRHHGIKGQKWGVKNGPPYPLGASDHSSSEKKAGWKVNNTLAKKKESNVKKVVVVDDRIIPIKKCNTTKMQDLNIINSKMSLSHSECERIIDGNGNIKDFGKTLINTISGRLSNCQGCTYCGVLRRQGYDVVAKTSNQKMMDPSNVKKYFKNASYETVGVNHPLINPIQVSAERGIKRSQIRDYIPKLEKKMIAHGDGTYGNFIGCGHSVEYYVSNGGVQIYDNQLKTRYSSLNEYVKRNYDSAWYSNDIFAFARLDNCEPNFKNLIRDEIIEVRR